MYMATLDQIGKQLGIHKSVVSKLAKRGMPLDNIDAANDWRKKNAPPRNVDKKFGTIKQTTTTNESEVVDESNPELSVKLARQAEKTAWNRLSQAQKVAGLSSEEFRKVNATYISARQNRMRAENDYKDWKRVEGITLYLSEAQLLIAKPHQLCAQLLQAMPKQLSARLCGQSVKEIETILVEWCDNLASTIQQGI